MRAGLLVIMRRRPNRCAGGLLFNVQRELSKGAAGGAAYLRRVDVVLAQKVEVVDVGDDDWPSRADGGARLAVGEHTTQGLVFGNAELLERHGGDANKGAMAQM